MASVDPYMPCPCGSGQKFKWCCQKVESYAERAQRMVESGQFESSLKPLEEGLARFPDNAWLLTRKAIVEVHLKRFDAAKATLQRLLEKNPGHMGGTILMTRLLLETEGPDAAIAQFQQGLSAIAGGPAAGAGPAGPVPGRLAAAGPGLPIAAMKHLELAARWAGDLDKDRSIARSIATQRLDPRLSAWEKNPYRLRPVPEGVTDAFRESFERAMGWAEEGLWASAASAFELLSAGSSAGAIADRNRGPVLPVDRRPRGRHRRPAPIHRPHRADGRGGRPRGPLPAPRGRPGRGDRRVRPPDLADPRPRGAAAGPRGRPLLRAGARAPHPPRRPGLAPDRAVLPARSPADRGEARAVAARHPDRRGRGDRRRGLGRAGDLRRQPARPPDRPVHGRGRRDDPAGASRGPRSSRRCPGIVLAMSWQWSLPAGPPGRGRRAARPRAAGLHPRRGLARDAQPGPAAAGRRSRRPRPATPRRRSAPRSGCWRPPSDDRATCSTGARSARGWASRPSRPSTRATSTSTGSTCRDGR